MIEREQVLHVARLSRLKLDDDEVSRIETELSSILEHVDRLAEIDIEGIEPTSHVVPLENVLRDDVARPSLDRDVALDQAPDPVDGAFRVPSPQAEG